jgi:hypothetical protein
MATTTTTITITCIIIAFITTIAITATQDYFVGSKWPFSNCLTFLSLLVGGAL